MPTCCNGEENCEKCKGSAPRYQPIENYGVIGNMHTVALISRHRASIDFFCYPDFDSPTVFGRLLDYEKGGFFEITPSFGNNRHLQIVYCQGGNGQKSEASTFSTLTPGTPTLNLLESHSSTFDFSSATLGTTSYESSLLLQKSRIRTKQLYLPSSNVLVTRFSGKEGITQVTDLMPVKADGTPSVPWLVRKLECIRGTSLMDVTIMPAFDYARSDHLLQICSIHNRILFSSRFISMDLCWVTPIHPIGDICRVDGSCSLQKLENNIHYQTEGQAQNNPTWRQLGKPDRPGASATFLLVEGQSIIFALRQVSGNFRSMKPLSSPISLETSFFSLDSLDMFGYEFVSNLIGETLSFWHSWIAGCSYTGRWREMVHRSALLLKLLTYAPTGAIVAAPTFGLPEEIGGFLNWDYRFTWIRDAAFTIYAFLRIGFKQEALAFMEFIEQRCKDIDPSKGRHLQVLYDIRGNSPAEMIQAVRARSSWYETADDDHYAQDSGTKGNMTATGIESVTGTLDDLYLTSGKYEMILGHLDGYCSSKPVRIGNAACDQMQTDIYGELMDGIYLVDKWAHPISYDFWCFIKNTLVPQVLSSSLLPDHGIWELRHGQRHYTYSKVMSWVALDRAIRLASKHSFPSEERDIWRPARDALFEQIMEKGWSDQRGAFVQYYGSTDLDASSLVMPLVFFLPPTDPKFLKTLEQILKPTRLGGLTANNLCFRWSVWEPTSSPSSMVVMVLPDPILPTYTGDISDSSDIGNRNVNNGDMNIYTDGTVYTTSVTDFQNIGENGEGKIVNRSNSSLLHLTNPLEADKSSTSSLPGSMMVLRNEGTFNLCSFWLVEAMARAGSKISIPKNDYLERAVLKFEDIIGYANHLGLFSEEISASGEALGNFPQAFTHLALISAAFNIDRKLDEKP